MQDIEAEALIELARLRLEQSRLKEAEATINLALRLCQRCGYKLYEADAELLKARLYLAQNNPDQVKTLAQSAYAKADSMHYHWSKIEANQLLKAIRCA